MALPSASQTTVSFSAQGTGLYVQIAGLYTPIMQITKLTGPGITDTIATISTLSSPGGFEEVKPLMKKPTAVTFSMVWNPSDPVVFYLQASKAAYPAPLEKFIEVQSDPAGTIVSFSGYVTKFEPTSDVNTVGMMAVEITPTGPPAFSFTTSPSPL